MEMMMDFLSMTFLPFFCDGSYSILRSSNTRPAGCHPQRRLMTFFTSVQNVRFWHIADIATHSVNVRFWG